MITRLHDENEYHNAIQLAGLLVFSEMMEAFEYIKIYDLETGEWSARRIFWYVAAAIPALFITVTITLAAFKYLWT